MHSTRTLSALWAFVLFAGGPLAQGLVAQSIPSPYRFIQPRHEAGAFAGSVRTAAGRFDAGPQSGALYGLRYGLEIAGPVGLEGVVSYFPTIRDVVDPRRAEGERVRGEADVQLLTIDARLRFSLTGRRTWHGLNPVLFAGGGVGFDLAGEQEDDLLLREQDRFRFGFAFLGVLGGGVRWMISERFLARGDAHLALWQLNTPEGFLDPELGFEAPPLSEWTNNSTFTLGLAYRF